MQSRSLPLTELVTLAYLGALLLALSLMGCQSDAPAEADTASITETTRVERPSPSVTAPAAEVPAFEIVTSTVPETPRVVTFEEADAAFKARDYADAQVLFASYVDAKPSNPFGHYMLGLSARKSGDLETAESALRTALDLDSTLVRGWQNLARVLLDTQRPDEALMTLEKGRTVDPENGVTFRLIGRALHASDRPDEAADSYRDAILANDLDAWAMNNLALVLMEQGRHLHAAETLARATTIRPEEPLFQNNLGMALEQAGQFASARDAYAQAVTLRGDYGNANANLARLETSSLIEMDRIDLDELAERFVQEVESWRDEHVARELGEVEETLAEVANIK